MAKDSVDPPPEKITYDVPSLGPDEIAPLRDYVDTRTPSILAIIFSVGFIMLLVGMICAIIAVNYFPPEPVPEKPHLQEVLVDLLGVLIPVFTGYIGIIIGYYFQSRK